MPLQVGELFAFLGLDQSKFDAGLKNAETKFVNLGKKLENIGGKMKAIGGKMSLAVTAPIVGAATASFHFAAELEDAMGAADQIFGSASEEMKSWAKNLETYYGIATGEALEYGNMMGSMLQNIGGLTEAEAAKQSQTLLKLAGDLTAMYGGTTEDAVRALTGALKGNNTMLDNYGMAANDALVKTKALEMGIYKGKGEMDLATKQAATLALIMEQSGAAQGQAAREADGASGSLRAFKTEAKNLAATFGNELLPTLTPLLSSLNKLMKSFINLSPTTKKTVLIIAGVAAAIGPLLVVLGTLAGAIASISAALPILGGFFAALLGPVGAVIAIVAALVVGGILLIKNWDKVKAFGVRMWDSIKTAWHNAGVYLKDQMRLAGQGIIDIWNKIKATIMGAIAKALEFAGATDKAAAVQLEANEAKYARLGTALELKSGQAGRRNGLGFGGYATGTSFHPGGLSWVGERGPELVNLPRGAQVLNNRDSMALAGRSQTIDHSGTVYHVFQTNDRQTVAKIAQEFERGNRRIPSRVTTMPSMA